MRKHWVLSAVGVLLVQVLVVVSLASTGCTRSRTTRGLPAETKEERDARMKWWREARFGMFIHWGVLQLLAVPHSPGFSGLSQSIGKG